ncbi:MAG: universal stress protein [Actinobacteria bacterium]|nr:universal stress protein [Actinomycetota bacterium]
MTIGLVAAVIVLATILLFLTLRRRHPKPRALTARRLLVPFTGGALDQAVLDAALRVARAEEATLVPAYLVIVPLWYAEDAPLRQEVQVAMPLLEAVEHAALRAGVPVDARIERGRSAIHALQRLWAIEEFDRVIAPAPAHGSRNGRRAGFSAKDLTWILTQAPFETLVLKPAPELSSRPSA